MADQLAREGVAWPSLIFLSNGDLSSWCIWFCHGLVCIWCFSCLIIMSLLYCFAFLLIKKE